MLEKWNRTADLDAELVEPSYICLRCLGLLERYKEMYVILLKAFCEHMRDNCCRHVDLR